MIAPSAARSLECIAMPFAGNAPANVQVTVASFELHHSLRLLAIASIMDRVKVGKTPNLGSQLGSLGEFIAGQRRAAELTLRQLADQAGVSNPYLSQIERGLRRPSAEVLQQLARALRVSAETLYVRAGILDPDDHPHASVEMAVLSDTESPSGKSAC